MARPSEPPRTAEPCLFEGEQGLIEWATLALESRGQTPAKHHRLLLSRLHDLSTGAIDRLMVQMPPGSAKSTYTSAIFPAWWLSRHPGHSIIAASHTASLARHHGRDAREMVRENEAVLGFKLEPGARAAAEWRTTNRGQYFAAGVNGPITGRRADLIIIDDPIKSHTEAGNSEFRQKLLAWYGTVLMTRLKPGGRVVLVMTRWHEDDLAGRLLATQPDEWHCLRLPALAEKDDPLDRAVGEPLWPEYISAAAWERTRQTVGERSWAALYQQRPRAADGSVFTVGAIQTLSPPWPEMETVVRGWDLASTLKTDTNDPDWTAGVKLGRDQTGRFVILDVTRARGTHHDIEMLVTATARSDGTRVTVGLPKDPATGGVWGAYLVGRLAGFRTDLSPETGGKDMRAWPFASQIQGGNVAMMPGAWNHAFIDELREFPHGTKDDQVDALSRAFGLLLNAAPATRRIDTSTMVR